MRTLICFILLHPLSVAAQEILMVRPFDYPERAEDFAPTLLDSTLVFCSIRESAQTIRYVDMASGKPLTDLYSIDLRKDKPVKPTLFSDPLTTPMHDGPFCSTPTGDQIILTRNQARPRKLGDLRAGGDQFGLFISKRGQHDWAPTEPFLYNHPDWSTMHAALSPDGTQLVFVSDMPGGHGGFDLYITEWEDGEWMIPLNLGPTVNSAGNEVFPMWHTNGNLYFSSDRSGGIGKYDILVCQPQGDAWGTPAFLPAPINSSGNDIGYTAWPHDRQGFFSSDRSGEDRIYQFSRTIEPFQDCEAQQPFNPCYRFHEDGLAGIEKLPLRYEWDLGDGTVIGGLDVQHCYARAGAYIISLNIVDTLSGRRFHRKTAYELRVEAPEQAVIHAPDTVLRSRTFKLKATTEWMTNFTPVEFHWRMAPEIHKIGRSTDHAATTTGIHEIQLDVIGVPLPDGRIPHSCVTRKVMVVDRIRSSPAIVPGEEYTDASEVWDEFEYQELEGDELRMMEMGNGDVIFSVELFASRERVSLDDPRFTLIKQFYPVIERFDPKRRVYTYSVGEAKDPVELYATFQKVLELRFLEAEVMLLKEEEVVDASDLLRMDLLMLNNTVVRASAVKFAKNSAHIDPTFLAAMRSILALLQKYPTLQLVIEAHTDDTGSDAHNLRLSQARAKAAENWFIDQGVNAGRLIAIGFGEHRPLASNATEEGRGMNRRVEFRLSDDDAHQATMR